MFLWDRNAGFERGKERDTGYRFYVTGAETESWLKRTYRVCALSRNKKLNQKLCNGQSQKIVIL